MKVGFIIGDLSQPGGGERVVVNLANYFVNRNDEAVIYHYGKGSKYYIDERVSVVEIDNHHSKWLLRKVQRLIGIWGIKHSSDIDVIFTFGWAPSIYGAFVFGGSIPYIASERIDPQSEPSSIFFRILRDYAYKRSELLVCQTNDAANYFRKIKTRVILNPVKDSLPPCHIGKRRKAIVNFGRFTKQKNLGVLIDSFFVFWQSHKNYVLEIYGYGPLKDELSEQVKKRGIEKSVLFYPFSENVHSKIVDASMYVSSSIYEGLSNSLLEAMAIGLPVICTDCPIGGARMVIQDHVNGLIVPVNDEKRLVSAMIEIADNEVLSDQLSMNARSVREKLSMSRICKEWYELSQMYRR